MSSSNDRVIYSTEHVLTSLCNSVTRVLTVATQSQIQYSAMVQRITKTCLRPDIGCFVLFDGGFSGLMVINFSAQAAMELYSSCLLSMGMSKDELARSYTADEVSNVMGELMNQVAGDFTSNVRRELQTHITQNQPKMLVTFYTGSNNIFYLELAIDRTEFIKLYDFEPQARANPDEVMAEANAPRDVAPPPPPDSDTDELLRSLGM